MNQTRIIMLIFRLHTSTNSSVWGLLIQKTPKKKLQYKNQTVFGVLKIQDMIAMISTLQSDFFSTRIGRHRSDRGWWDFQHVLAFLFQNVQNPTAGRI